MLLLSLLTGNLHCHTKTQQNSEIKLTLQKFQSRLSNIAERRITEAIPI